MRRVILVILVGLAVVLQLSLLPALRPFGVVPNVALVMVVLVALSVATSEALIAAAASGLVLDLASGANFGLWTGVLILVSLIVGMTGRAGIELSGAFVAPALVAAGTVVMTAAIWASVAPHVSSWPVGVLAGAFLIELVINLSLTLILRPVVQKMLAGGKLGVDSGT